MPRFLESLDTIPNESSNAIRAAAEVQFTLLCGRGVVLSQTQAFDGSTFLSFAQDEHRTHFLSLISEGRIRVHLLPDADTSHPPSLRKVLVSKVADPSFHLSGWAEIPQPHQKSPAELEERQRHSRLLSEALVAKKHNLNSLGDSLSERWESLCMIDEALAKAKRLHSKSSFVSTTTPRRGLEESLQAAASDLFIPEALRRALGHVVMVGGNFRSRYHTAVNHEIETDDTTRRELHKIINSEYNRVVAESLCALPNLLATSPVTTKALCRNTPQGNPDSRVVEDAPEFAGQLQGLTWKTFIDLLHMLEGKESANYKQDAIKACKLLAAKEIVDYDGNHRLAIVMSTVLTSALAGAVAGKAGGILMEMAGLSIPAAIGIPNFAKGTFLQLLAAVCAHYTGWELSPTALVKKQLREKRLAKEDQVIINIIKHHPRYPRELSA